MYVDDLIKSLRGVEVASKFCVDATAALKDGGFTLCKWKSSHPAALEGIDDSARAPASVPSDAPGAPVEMGRILGMKYSFETDSFYCVICNSKTSREKSSLGRRRRGGVHWRC